MFFRTLEAELCQGHDLVWNFEFDFCFYFKMIDSTAFLWFDRLSSMYVIVAIFVTSLRSITCLTGSNECHLETSPQTSLFLSLSTKGKKEKKQNFPNKNSTIGHTYLYRQLLHITERFLPARFLGPVKNFLGWLPGHAWLCQKKKGQIKSDQPFWSFTCYFLAHFSAV